MSTRKEKVAEAETKRKTPGERFGKTIEEVKPIDKVEEMKPTDKAVAKNPVTTIKTPTIPTLSDMLATQRTEQRKAIEKDKTDAVKMQKYYALTDALGALGKMGGTAIGGAIGGGALDSAPVVAEYQPSRGYVNAFEKAKQANDRLRALDERDFQLAYNKAQRDEERDYRQKEAEKERAFRIELDKLDKEWRKNFFDYQTKIEQEVARGNMDHKAQLEADAVKAAQAYQTARDAILHKYDMEEKQLSKEIVELQTGTSGQKNSRSFTLTDGSVANIPLDTFEEMKAFYVDKGIIDGVNIDVNNVESFLRTRPDLVADFVSKHGVDYQTNFVAPVYKTEEEIKEEEKVEKKENRKSSRAHRKQNNNFYSPTVGGSGVMNPSRYKTSGIDNVQEVENVQSTQNKNVAIPSNEDEIEGVYWD